MSIGRSFRWSTFPTRYVAVVLLRFRTVIITDVGEDGVIAARQEPRCAPDVIRVPSTLVENAHRGGLGDGARPPYCDDGYIIWSNRARCRPATRTADLLLDVGWDGTEPVRHYVNRPFGSTAVARRLPQSASMAFSTKQCIGPPVTLARQRGPGGAITPSPQHS